MRTATLVVLLALAPVARAQAPADYVIDTKGSTVTYEAQHPAHKWKGVSRAAEGRARVLPDGKVQVMVRVPVESFDSDNSNRDAHMKEVVEAARFGFIEVKATGEAPLPAKFPATVEKTFKAQVSFHGVQQVFDVPVKVSFESDRRILTEAHFAISIDGFKLERPSLMLVKMDDAVKIDARLTFNR